MSDVERMVEARRTLGETAALLDTVRRRLHVAALMPVAWNAVMTDRARRALVLTATGLGERVRRG